MNTQHSNANRDTNGFKPWRIPRFQSSILPIFLSSDHRPPITLFTFFTRSTLLTLLLLAGTVRAATVTWNGSTNVAWENSANWTWSGGGSGYPGAGDDVVIDGGGTAQPTLDLNAVGGSPYTINSLSVGATTASTLTFKNCPVATKRLKVTGNATIGASGKLTHTAETSSGAEAQQLYLDVGGDLTINGSSPNGIYVTGCGYIGSGPGAAANDTYGASHGGQGGTRGTTFATTYGLATDPVRNGSGYVLSGQRGGGTVKLVVGGALNLNGTMVADGGGAGNWENCSGGSVNITAGTLTGSGTVSANGAGGLDCGGGGGRVAIVLTGAPYSSFSTFTIQAYGGTGGDTVNRRAAAGTVYLKGNDTTYGRLIVDNNVATTTSARTYQVSDLTVGDVILRNNGRMSADSTTRKLTVYGSWSNAVAADAFGTPSVELAGSAAATVWGANNWQSLTITTAGKTVTFQSGVTQTINAGGALTLTGDSVNALTLNSTSPSTKWNLKATPTSVVAVNYVNATDSDASTGDTIKAPNSTITTCSNWSTGPVAVTWKSDAATRNWGTLGNWNPAQLPLDWDDVTIVSAANSPLLDVARTIGSLTVATGGNLGLNGRNLTVNRNMTVTGTVAAAGSEILTAGSNLTFVIGSVFTPAQSTVRLGGAGPQAVSLANNTFYILNNANTNAISVTDAFTTRDLTFTNSSINVSFLDNFTATNVQAFVTGASKLTFGSGKTYTAYTFTLVGSAANKMTLTSSGTWALHVTGFGGVGNVTVNGSDASGGGYKTIYAANSDNNGGNLNWDFGANNKVWMGGSTDWTVSGNWSPSGQPDPTHDVLILAGAAAQPVVDLVGGTKTIKSLVLPGASTLTFANGNANLATSKLRVDGNVTIGANATLTHLLETRTTTGVLGDEQQRLFLDVGGDLTISGSIDASLKGYNLRPSNAGGYGYAYGDNNSAAGHAGTANGMHNDVYGSVTNPIYSGSANNSGPGGGIVKLVVAGTLTVNSTASILSEGSGGYNGSAGGSVNITAGKLAGSGTVSAKSRNTTDGAGSSSGGRVAIILTNAPDTAIYSLTLSANGGRPTSANGGGAGTIYVKGTNTPNGRLIVDNANSPTTTFRTRIKDNDLIVDDVVLRNQGRLEFTGGKQAIVYGSWSNGVDVAASGTPTVTLAGSATSTVWGANNWQSLTITNAGKVVSFQTNVVQYIYGVPTFSNNVTLQSTASGVWWYLRKPGTGTQDVGVVTVQDSNATNGWTFVAPAGAADNGHNVNWLFQAAKGMVFWLR